MARFRRRKRKLWWITRKRLSSRRGRYTRRSKRFTRRGSKGHLRVSRLKSRSTIVPDVYYTKTKYYYSATTIAASSPFYIIWNGNSQYDPLYTGPGKNPEGTSSLAALYRKYQVQASKITVRCHNTSGSDIDFYVLPYDGSYTTLGGTGIPDPPTQRNIKVKTVPANCGAQSQKVISYYMTSAKMFEMPLVNLGEACAAQITANPARMWQWYVGADYTDSTTTGRPAGLVFSYVITYYTKFYAPNVLFNSSQPTAGRKSLNPVLHNNDPESDVEHDFETMSVK